MAERRNYILLRVKRPISTAEPFSLPDFDIGVRGARSDATAAVVPTFEQAELTTSDIADIARDPSVSAIAPEMPIHLIEPMDGPPAAAAAGPTWGISAIGADTSPLNGDGVVVEAWSSGLFRKDGPPILRPRLRSKPIVAICACSTG